MSTLDEKLDALTFEEKLEINRRVRLGQLTLKKGDRIAATRRLRGTYIDEALEDEAEDCRIPYHVPGGTLGRVVLVRQYVAPFPYVVLFDNDVELSVEQGDIERVAD
ncbi:hypothetical protein AB0E08_08240 [Streptomyces sp. NPDC048281]|uniref:hypothetical protein n=1 Tax=Streptomyces sp. NPDC048281 TaxID=3154715 RepID=UPI0034451629